MDNDERLNAIYYEPGNDAGYSGARRILHKTKNIVDKNNFYKWLSAQDTYTLHKRVLRKFPRLHYNVSGFDSVWECDLSDLSSISEYNDNYAYLLFVIDVLSKFLWVEPIKDKSSLTVVEAFKKIFARSKNRKPDTMQSDRGGEFMGNETKNFLKGMGIQHREASNPDIKASIVERVQRTIKEKMFRYLTHRNSKRYIDVLQNIVQSYNDGYHTSIKMAPSAVTIYNAHLAWQNIQKRFKPIKYKKPKFKCLDLVRISKTKGTFEKGYLPNYSEEIFKIKKVLSRRKPTVYILEDLNGEEIDSIFYEQELCKVQVADDRTYKIDKILKTSGKGDNKKYFVSWFGYGSKFNSWISAKDIQDI